MISSELNRSEDALQFLASRYSELTDGEKKIADYLITNLDEALSMSVHMLAQKSGVSVATIVRYAQHMGFDGYKAFRLHLAQRHAGREDFLLDFPDTSSNIEKHVSRVLLSSMETIRGTLEEMDYEALDKAAGLIKSANRILFFGTGTSNIVCNDAMLKYQRAGKTAYSAGDVYSAALILSNFTADDVLVTLSHSGSNADSLRVIQTAKKTGHKTVAVTSFVGSPIAKTADLVLCTKTRESPLHNISITSRIGQFAVMDALFMAYLTIDYHKCTEHNETILTYLNDFGII